MKCKERPIKKIELALPGELKITGVHTFVFGSTLTIVLEDSKPTSIYEQIKDPEQLKKLQGEKKQDDVMRRDE